MFENIISDFFDLVPLFFDAAFAVVTAASAIAAITRTPSDDAWSAKVYAVLDVLALNVGYAKDKPRKAGGRFVPK